MGTIIVKDVVKRKPGYIYYIDKNGSVCEAKMARGRKKGTKKVKVKVKKVKKLTLKKLAAKKVKKKK